VPSSRRQFLSTLAAPAFAAAAESAPKQKIVSVEATPVNLWSRSTQGALPKFSGPNDPNRWRYTGPYAQLASAMIVTIKTDQGVTGYGLGAGGAAAATIIHGHLRNLLLGMNPLDIELLWDQMYTSSAMYGRRGVFVMALSGVDNALWDVAGKTMNQPVYRLLGGTTKEKAPSYFTSADPEAGLALGFEHFKLPIRDGVFEGRAGMDRTEGVLREARQAIGPDRSLMIDCGLRWDDLAYAKEMARRLEPVRLYFIEEPLSPDNVLGYSELVREVDSTLIASGEHEYTQYGFEMLFHHSAVEVVQPDVTWCGGVTALRKIAALCGARGLTFLPHRGGSLFGLPLVLSTPHAPLAESFGTGDAASDLMLAMTARFEKGHYFPPEKPGFGTEISDELIRKHRRETEPLA
jgi:L-rhamnonate dehydratase